MSSIKFNKSSKNPNKVERKFYQAWIAMRYRCSGKHLKSNKRYFDREIVVCERWESFNYFYIDMWDTYLIHHKMFGSDTELDRINNNKGYCKVNCRWVTREENTNNRSSRRVFKGKTLTQWAKTLGVNRSTLAQRYYVYGWSIDKVLEI